MPSPGKFFHDSYRLAPLRQGDEASGGPSNQPFIRSSNHKRRQLKSFRIEPAHKIARIRHLRVEGIFVRKTIHQNSNGIHTPDRSPRRRAISPTLTRKIRTLNWAE